jgi:hypothetical protein
MFIAVWSNSSAYLRAREGDAMETLSLIVAEKLLGTNPVITISRPT